MSVTRCKHLTLAGARCTYPSLLNKEFCYDLHRTPFYSLLATPYSLYFQ